MLVVGHNAQRPTVEGERTQGFDRGHADAYLSGGAQFEKFVIFAHEADVAIEMPVVAIPWFGQPVGCTGRDPEVGTSEDIDAKAPNFGQIGVGEPRAPVANKVY